MNFIINQLEQTLTDRNKYKNRISVTIHVDSIWLPLPHFCHSDTLHKFTQYVTQSDQQNSIFIREHFLVEKFDFALLTPSETCAVDIFFVLYFTAL